LFFYQYTQRSILVNVEKAYAEKLPELPKSQEFKIELLQD